MTTDNATQAAQGPGPASTCPHSLVFSAPGEGVWHCTHCYAVTDPRASDSGRAPCKICDGTGKCSQHSPASGSSFLAGCLYCSGTGSVPCEDPRPDPDVMAECVAKALFDRYGKSVLNWEHEDDDRKAHWIDVAGTAIAAGLAPSPCDCHSANNPDGKRPAVFMDNGKAVSIDACIAPVVRALWAAGIITRASCCGHGLQPPSVIIKSGHEHYDVLALIRTVDSRLFSVQQEEDPRPAAGISERNEP